MSTQPVPMQPTLVLVDLGEHDDGRRILIEGVLYIATVHESGHYRLARYATAADMRKGTVTLFVTYDVITLNRRESCECWPFLKQAKVCKHLRTLWRLGRRIETRQSIMRSEVIIL